MKQLLLNLDIDHLQTLDSFIVGQHAELITLLRRYDQNQPGSLGERAVYIWGDTGSGKSHLLHALTNKPATRYLNQASQIADFDYDPAVHLYMVDDCQLLDPAQQIAAFDLYNQIRDRGGLWAASGDAAPGQMTLREDLRTRLGWGLIYQLSGLTDQEKIEALERAAAARGVTVPEGVLPYLITHFQRDMPSLSGMLDALINLSLEIKRPITLPFLREVIVQQTTQATSNKPKASNG